MNKLIMLFIVYCLVQISIKSQTLQDTISIRETTMNYIEGWYSGDSVRMSKSLHPELAKRGIVPSKDGKSMLILKVTYAEMIQWTGKRPNLLKDNKDLLRKLTILEIGKNIATVKCESKDFIDYLHLARINDEWKILNAIWEFNDKEVKKK
jgi:hypothetical protein